MKRKSNKKDLDKSEDKSDKDDKSDKKEIDVEDGKDLDKDKSSNDSEKALFVQRLCAYIIDLLLVSFVASLICTPFVDNKKIEDLNETANTVMEKYANEEISAEEYIVEYSNVAYDTARSTGINTIVTIIVCILYYVVFQLYNKGSTFGKQLLGIRVVSTNGDLSMNQMIFRTFIANSLLLNILSIAFITFASRDVYFGCVGLFSLVQYIITIVSLFMVMYSKNGLAIHDRLVHTKVIKIK